MTTSHHSFSFHKFSSCAMQHDVNIAWGYKKDSTKMTFFRHRHLHKFTLKYNRESSVNVHHQDKKKICLSLSYSFLINRQRKDVTAGFQFLANSFIKLCLAVMVVCIRDIAYHFLMELKPFIYKSFRSAI